MITDSKLFFRCTQNNHKGGKFYRILMLKCIYFNGSLINFLTTYFREINLKLHHNGLTKKKLSSEQVDRVFDPKFHLV